MASSDSCTQNIIPAWIFQLFKWTTHALTKKLKASIFFTRCGSLTRMQDLLTVQAISKNDRSNKTNHRRGAVYLRALLYAGCKVENKVIITHLLLSPSTKLSEVLTDSLLHASSNIAGLGFSILTSAEMITLSKKCIKERPSRIWRRRMSKLLTIASFIPEGKRHEHLWGTTQNLEKCETLKRWWMQWRLD